MWNFFKSKAYFIFNKKQEDILSAAFVIGFSVALSRILGLIRYRLLASYFGQDIKLLDSFVAASVLPDAIFEVLIFGAIALAFIPVFSQYISRDKLEKAWAVSSTMITLGLVVFAIFTVLIMVFANSISPIVAPGLVAREPETKLIIARLLRVMVLAQLFFVISIFLTGILQSFQRFLVPALASVFYNIGIIISIIFLYPIIGIYAPAVGMILGALLHMLVQLPLIYSLGFKFRFNFNFKNTDVMETFKMMWPRSISLGLLRLSDLINIALASIATLGSIVAFNFAQVLQLVPSAFFAAPIAQAALPTLSIEYNSKNIEQFKKVFTNSFNQILYLVLPSAAILAILRIPIVRLVFGAKELPWEITVLTGRILIAFAIGIAASAMSLLMLRGFHAVRDSITPVKINLVTVTINIILSVTFVYILKFSVIWLALSYSIANIINFFLMLYFLNRKVHGFDKIRLLVPAGKMFMITALMAVSLYAPMKLLDQLIFDTTKTINLIFLTAIAAAVGISVYIVLSWLLKIQELVMYIGFMKRVIFWPRRLVAPPPTSIEAQDQMP